MNKNYNIPLKFSEEVADALHDGSPIVALESNVITHGLPYPDNALTAKKVEEAVRKGGAIPATIGIKDGEILIGMSFNEIEQFSKAKNIPKIGNRDISILLAQRNSGATTVASTIMIAELANINFFASAGIGGVHRGAEQTMDISADLMQFTKSKVAMVCAGAKNILDLGLTMEYLETHGVPIISYQSDYFPAFYCKSSGFKSPHRIDNITKIADVIQMHWAFGNKNSMLITKSINDEDAIDEREVEDILNKAIINAEKKKISGNAITKYLMQIIDRETQGRTARANASVLISNAEFAGNLASVYVSITKEAVL
ncbi:pseudouridine-5'-phosphate glycosidase [Tenacibaculum sp. C7A-26P2]|uniref:pseudouridine-5'-phosphate glycosidase n=1 Tax=Tenacibaculum sp. C7A-26P2 TaxID=3447504 RepID=UPI003F8395B8